MNPLTPSDVSRIWLVDDSPLQAQVARRALSSMFEIDVFHDGASMLEALQSREAPNLLILDWHMPGLSGLEVCSFVRQSRDPGQLPILFLTASDAPDSLVEALEAGANDFVMKPFSERELQSRVSALLRNGSLHARLAETERRLRVEGEFRESFIGMLAHDLRQPLNTFVLANQALAAAVENRNVPLLAMQRRAADRMSRMVTELLDFARSRPESGMPVDRRSMDLAELAGSILDEIRMGHPGRSFDLVVEGSCIGTWDRDRMAQLCSNLVGNAIEHGAPTSPITLSVRQDAGAVALSVSNQGEPLSPEVAATIFHPFHRGRGAAKRSKGLGLGLHIVSEIARAHGGTVSVRSDVTATVFEVVLPVGT